MVARDVRGQGTAGVDDVGAAAPGATGNPGWGPPDDVAGGSDPGDGARGHGRFHWVRLALSAGLLAAAVVLMISKAGQLESAAERLVDVDPAWVAVAVVAEAGSMLAFARLQQRLLLAGDVHPPFGRMSAITLATNAVDTTLPGGIGWAAAWLFHQLGRCGVTRFLRVWMFLVAGGVSSFALFIVVSSGVLMAGAHGPFADLRWLVFLLALIPLVVLLIGLAHHTGPVQRSLERLERRIERAEASHPSRWSPDRALTAGASLVHRFLAVRLPALGWVEVLTLGLANWLFDCTVVVCALLALHVSVPWRAILVVYGLTQISASFPITPGGIGIVEGSLVALLHVYGVGLPAALAAAGLYRILSFWILVPIGWAVFGGLTLARRREENGAAPAGAPRGASRAPALGNRNPEVAGGEVAAGGVLLAPRVVNPAGSAPLARPRGLPAWAPSETADGGAGEVRR